MIDFNAWRQENLGPPWWALIRKLNLQGLEQYEEIAEAKSVGSREKLAPRWNWWWWRCKVGWLPWVTAGAVSLGVIGLAFLLTKWSTEASVLQSLNLLLTILIAAGLLIVALFARSRALFLGSAKSVEAYEKLRDDPLRPFRRFFTQTICRLRQPVAIFIDDLDRCSEEYVVRLLEGIQTLFKAARVTYVVAADRDWICASFEKVYENFTGEIGTPGRPLGHLFLDKLFQVSVPVPAIHRETRIQYWKHLLEEQETDSAESADVSRKEAEKNAAEEMRGVKTRAEAMQYVRRFENDPVRGPIYRKEFAVWVSGPKARSETETFLHRYYGLVESNPRAMKRVVNAFGMRQAIMALEDRAIDLRVLARWTILELRWPRLADHLAEQPDELKKVGKAAPPDEAAEEDGLAQLLRSNAVLRVVRKEDDDDASVLKPDRIRAIVGTPR